MDIRDGVKHSWHSIHLEGLGIVILRCDGVETAVTILDGSTISDEQHQGMRDEGEAIPSDTPEQFIVRAFAYGFTVVDVDDTRKLGIVTMAVVSLLDYLDAVAGAKAKSQ